MDEGATAIHQTGGLHTVTDRFFWVKSDGTVQEISWEEYRELALSNLRRRSSRFHLLVAVVGKGINFFKKDSVYVKLSILEQILQAIKEETSENVAEGTFQDIDSGNIYEITRNGEIRGLGAG